jgi:hypothetical protein
LIDHDHLNGVIFGHVIADPNTLGATLATVHCHICGSVFKALLFSHLLAILNGIGLGTILSTKLTALRGTNFDIDMGY